MVKSLALLITCWQRLSLLVVLAGAPFIPANSQDYVNEQDVTGRLNLTGGPPENLLNSKTVLLHSFTLNDKELTMVQEYFQKGGVDAVAYYPMDMVFAGQDVTKAFADQLVKREITNLAFVEKSETGFRISFTKFNGKESITDSQQMAWSVSNKSLEESLKVIQRTLSSQLKKQNLLINDAPEIGVPLNPITGKRNEFFAVDMKVDLVAVPKSGDENVDRELEKIMTENFPFKFKMTEPGVPEKELRKQGMFYVLCLIHTRPKVAKELLGYAQEKSETAVVSVTFPEGQPQLKNIPANTAVYKVYFKHIDSGNIFLGTKWDADVTWQSALLNNIRAMKAELRLN